MYTKNKEVIKNLTEEELWKMCFHSSLPLQKELFSLGRTILKEGLIFRQNIENKFINYDSSVIYAFSLLKVEKILTIFSKNYILPQVSNSIINKDVGIYKWYEINIPFQRVPKDNLSHPTFDNLLDWGCSLGIINSITPIFLPSNFILHSLVNANFNGFYKVYFEKKKDYYTDNLAIGHFFDEKNKQFSFVSKDGSLLLEGSVDISDKQPTAPYNFYHTSTYGVILDT